MSETLPFTIICSDGIKWCQRNKGKIPAILTSLPEMSEVNMDEKHYIPFLRRAASAVLSATTEDGYTIFIQTDRKSNGLIDKSYYITDEAMKQGARLLFHKIALIKGVDSKDLYKPTYSHVLCYSRNGTPGAPTPDVYERGKTLYANGAGIETVRRCLEYLQNKGINTIVDPFVGRGTTLIIAMQLGFDSGLGVDIDKKQCAETEENLLKYAKKTIKK